MPKTSMTCKAKIYASEYPYWIRIKARSSLRLTIPKMYCHCLHLPPLMMTYMKADLYLLASHQFQPLILMPDQLLSLAQQSDQLRLPSYTRKTYLSSLSKGLLVTECGNQQETLIQLSRVREAHFLLPSKLSKLGVSYHPCYARCM